MHAPGKNLRVKGFTMNKHTLLPTRNISPPFFCQNATPESGFLHVCIMADCRDCPVRLPTGACSHWSAAVSTSP